MQQTTMETHWPHEYTLKLCSVTEKSTLNVMRIKNQRSRQNSKNATKSKTNMVSAPTELTAFCRKQISIKYLTPPQESFFKNYASHFQYILHPAARLIFQLLLRNCSVTHYCLCPKFLVALLGLEVQGSYL